MNSVDASVASSGTNTTQNVNRPTNMVNGVFLLAWSAINAAQTLATPTGGTGTGLQAWQGAANTASGPGSASASGWGVWWKYVYDISLEPTQYTFTGGTLVSRHTTILPFYGLDPQTPVAQSGAAVSRTTASGVAANSPAVTADYAGQTLVSLFCNVNSAAATTSPPSGMTKIYENNGTQTRALAWALAAAVAGSNDPGAWTMTASNHGSASLVLNPARA